MKRILALVLSVACLCSSAAFAAATAGTARVGSGAAKTVTIDMHDGVTAGLVLAQGSVNKD